MPFRAGETLEFSAQWNKYVTAANVKLVIAGTSAFYGHEAWHFQATGHTLDPVRWIYTLDDQFDSYTDATSLACLQYESYLREQSKSQDMVVPMASAEAPAKKTGRRAPASRGPAADPQMTRTDTHVFMVLPGTRDPLGLLYALRAQDWQSEPLARFPVFDGHHYYDVAAQLEPGSGDETVAAGTFHVKHIALRVSEAGHELANVSFRLSLAQDPARTPVLIEAEVPVGTVRVELTSAK